MYALEAVQIGFTQFILGIDGLFYEGRLDKHNSYLLELRRVREDI